MTRRRSPPRRLRIEELEPRLTPADLPVPLDLLTPAGGVDPLNLTAVGANLFFVARTAAAGNELWVSNGTVAGTKLVKDINPGPADSRIRSLTAVRGLVYFVADDGTHGMELWRSNGTAAGTGLVGDLAPGKASAIDNGINGRYRGDLTAVGDTVYFGADAAGRDVLTSDRDQLWKVEGPSGTPVQVLTISPLTGLLVPIVNPDHLTDVNGSLFFFASGPSLGFKDLWKTAPGQSMASVVRDLSRTADVSEGEPPANVDGKLFFSASATSIPSNFELWVSDGTEAGTGLVKDINAGGSSSPADLTAYAPPGGRAALYFTADNGTGRNLWTSNGTSGGTVVAYVVPPQNSLLNLKAVGSRLYFNLLAGSKKQLWSSTGSQGGTTLFQPLTGGPDSAGEFVVETAAGFPIVDYVGVGTFPTGGLDSEIWQSDGRPDVTAKITNDPGRTGGTAPQFLTIAGGNVYYVALRSLYVLAPPSSPPPPPTSPPGTVRTFPVGYGGGPVVQVFGTDTKPVGPVINPFANTMFSILAGVRIASRDFNGDGVQDIACGTGPGARSIVNILDGKTGNNLAVVLPFEASFTGGVFVAAGDLTGDGVPDPVVSADVGGGPVVIVYDGAKLLAGAGGDSQITRFLGIDDPSFRGGARIAVGDVNGDGRPDLLVAAGFGGGPRVAVFDGRGVTTDAHPKLFGDFFVFEQTLRNGVYIAAGDLDGDGAAEVIVGGGPGGGPRVFALSGRGLMAGAMVQRANFFAGDPDNRVGVRVGTYQLDDDGRVDLLTALDTFVTGYSGKAIPADGTPPSLFAFDAFPALPGDAFIG